MGALNDYFSFTKRERTGAIVLIILIAIVFLLPEFFPAPKVSVDANSITAFRKQAADLKEIFPDSIAAIPGNHSGEQHSTSYQRAAEHDRKAMLFYFDPNTISADGWKKLGVTDRTVGTIHKYLAKGGSFRKAEDIGKVYGLRKDQYEQLLPFVRITGKTEKHEYAGSREYHKPANRIPAMVHMNDADTSMLIALPGIGSKLANRILNFRDRLGGFYTVEQVREVYGLPDSTFLEIKPYLQCDADRLHRININTADASTLKNHPYIKWNIANAIINYRSQHGEYSSVGELLKIDIIAPEVFQKIAPYLIVN